MSEIPGLKIRVFSFSCCIDNSQRPIILTPSDGKLPTRKRETNMTTSTAERVEIITTTYSKVVNVKGQLQQVVIKLTWFTNEEIDFSACNLEALGNEQDQDAAIMQLVDAKSDNVPGWKLKLS